MQKNDKIRILHISQVQGGIQTYIEQIINHIDSKKFELIVACPTERESLIKMVQKYNIPYENLEIQIEISPIKDLISIYNTVKLVRKLKPHIIHTHSSKAGMVARLAGIFYKPKVAYTPNAYAYLGQKGLKRSVLLWIERLGIPFTDFLLAASKSEANRSINDLHFPEKKVVVYPNSIQILPVMPKSHVGDKKLITMVGRLVYQKNPLMFVRVCKLVTDIMDDVVFQIVGAGFDDKLKSALEDYIQENNLHDKMYIAAWKDREALLQTIQDTDVFVMTSMFESFGYVAAEAQILEIPVVATNVDGLNEIVENNITGYLVEVNDDHEMAEKIIYLLKNPTIAKEMGRKGRIRVDSLFNIKNNIKILESFYTQNAIV